MKLSWKLKVLLFVVFFALAVVPAVVLASSNTQIALTPSPAYPAAQGSAQYQAQTGQQEFQLEVNHVRALAGQRVAVYVGGVKIGTARVGRRGVAELSRNSERHQRVPQVGAGTTVTVETNRSMPVVSGAFSTGSVDEQPQRKPHGRGARRELSRRSAAGLEVVLYRRQPTNQLSLSADDRGIGDAFEPEVEPADAPEAFEHPYPYAAGHDATFIRSANRPSSCGER